MPSKNLNRVPVYLSNDELAALEEIAKDWGTSKSGAIKEAINAVLYTKWQKPNIRKNWEAYKKSKRTSEKEEPDNSGETEEKPKITIFRNVAAKPRKTKTKSPEDEENQESQAGAIPSADETSQDEQAEAFSREEHTEMAIKLRRGEITAEDFRDYVERKHYREKKARQAEKKEKERQEAEAKAAKAAERKAKAEAKRQKEKAEKAAAEENARIDREIEKAKARAEAGEITPEELKAEINRLNDERPF